MEVSVAGSNESESIQWGINEQGATSVISVSVALKESLGRYLVRKRRKKPTRGTAASSSTMPDLESMVKEDIVEVDVVCKIEAIIEVNQDCENTMKGK